MGVISMILEFSGFDIEVSVGVVIGYFLFIYSQPSDVEVNDESHLFFCFNNICVFVFSFFLLISSYCLLYIAAACVFLFIIYIFFFKS
jgi:hypothetical protein